MFFFPVHFSHTSRHHWNKIRRRSKQQHTQQYKTTAILVSTTKWIDYIKAITLDPRLSTTVCTQMKISQQNGLGLLQRWTNEIPFGQQTFKRQTLDIGILWNLSQDLENFDSSSFHSLFWFSERNISCWAKLFSSYLTSPEFLCAF